MPKKKQSPTTSKPEEIEEVKETPQPEEKAEEPQEEPKEELKETTPEKVTPKVSEEKPTEESTEKPDETAKTEVTSDQESVKADAAPATITTPPTKKNSMKPILISLAIILFVLVVGGGIAFWFLFIKSKGSEDGGDNDNGGETEENCTYDAEFIEDVTIPADTEVDTSSAFTKTWKVKNIGTCKWEEGDVQLVFASGDPINSETVVNVPETKANKSVDVSINFTAPGTVGTYRSNWTLKVVDGDEFGDSLRMRIKVKEPEEEEEETPAAADLVITALTFDSSEVRKGVPFNIVATIKNDGGTNAVGFTWSWRACAHDTCPYIDSTETITLTPGEETTVQMPYTYTSWSTYTTDARVDISNAIEESNEDNNQRQLVIQVKPGLPDLIIESISFEPEPVREDLPTTVSIVVKNVGSEVAPGNFAAHWWSSTSAPAPACDFIIEDVNPGETKVLTCDYTYPSQYASITTKAEVDVIDEVSELNEDNNTYELPIEVVCLFCW